MPTTIYTIGHSNLNFMRFLSLLQEHNVNHIIDIRSIPYSRNAPWSNKSRLSDILKPFKIRYTYLGHKLGGKKPAREKFSQAETLSSLEIFNQAVQSLIDLSARDHLALLCAESDPVKCHRQHVIAQTLMDSEVKVIHILKDGQLLEAWREDTLAEQPELF
ncbi:MAG: DUF488 family protein [Brevefilum sp.]